MPIYFITGSDGKYNELKAIIPEVERLKIDLPEIQEIDANKIVAQKLYHALNLHKNKELIVDDTSLYFDCLKRLPGPFIRWFEDELGHEGLAELVEKLGNKKATAQTILGYAKNPNEMIFFSGQIRGEIVRPKGLKNFNWDVIFKPDGCEKTFAEMSCEEKQAISMRGIAARKLKKYLYLENKIKKAYGGITLQDLIQNDLILMEDINHTSATFAHNDLIIDLCIIPKKKGGEKPSLFIIDHSLSQSQNYPTVKEIEKIISEKLKGTYGIIKRKIFEKQGENYIQIGFEDYQSKVLEFDRDFTKKEIADCFELVKQKNFRLIHLDKMEDKITETDLISVNWKWPVAEKTISLNQRIFS